MTKSFRRIFLVGLALLLVVFWAAPRRVLGDGAVAERIRTAVTGQEFDFSSWLLAAIGSKITADLAANQAFLTEDRRTSVVRAYLERLDEVLALERSLEALYADPTVEEPDAVAATLRERLAAGRAELADLQPLAEAILQEQVAAVLLDEGFGIGGRVWPPVRMRLTPLPTLLVVSPRDEIRQLETVSLETGLAAPARAAIEQEIRHDLDLAAYVTDIGGLSVYPTMVLETTNLVYLVDVIAHEWSHTWFGQFPLGWNYAAEPAMRTINESAAGIIGREIGEAVIRRYYPDLVLPPPAPGEIPPPETSVPAPFDFRAEMRATRQRVDELLAAGEVAAAEEYMEERRQAFLANGYRLRVLNQAYFAFHGAYADEVGAAGDDPVGPLVGRIREAAPDLRTFMRELAFVSSYEELLAKAAEGGYSPADLDRDGGP